MTVENARMCSLFLLADLTFSTFERGFLHDTVKSLSSPPAFTSLKTTIKKLSS